MGVPDWSFVPGDAYALVTERMALVLSGSDAEGALERVASAIDSGAEQEDPLPLALDSLTSHGIHSMPDFCLLRTRGDAISGVVRGDLTLRIEGDWQASSVVTGEGVSTWREVAFEGVSRAAIIPAGSSVAPHTTTRDIRATPAPRGTSRVAALTYLYSDPDLMLTTEIDRGALARVSGKTKQLLNPNPHADELDAFPDDLFAEPDHVAAAVCEAGHPNPPERTECVSCGRPLLDTGLVQVPRTTRGTMILPNGDAIPLEGEIVLGRSPRATGIASHSVPTTAVIAEGSRDVSRSHARVLVEGWTVLIEDLGSTNGTMLFGTDGRQQRLRPHEPVVVSDGDVAVFGEVASVQFRGIA